SFIRMCLSCERDEFASVLELSQEVREGLVREGMERYVIRCDFARAMSLNCLGLRRESRHLLNDILNARAIARDSSLHGLVLLHLVDSLETEGLHVEAVPLLEEAFRVLHDCESTVFVQHAKLLLGELLRRRGRFAEAISSFRDGANEFAELGMARWEAYARLLLAETLLGSGNPQGAQAETVRALPILQELEVLPEGFAAVALLRESIRQRKADPEALRVVREHLRKER